MLHALQPERLEGVSPVIQSQMQKWGSSTLRELGSDVHFDVRNPLVADWLDAFRAVTLKQINGTTADQLRDVLADGVARGLGVEDMAREVTGLFGEIDRGRARVIARTETGSSMNAANLAAYQLSGQVDAKEWLATQDSVTRETHSEMDGQVQPITGYFKSPSGNQAQAPGQFGVAAEDVNCRCAVLPKLDDKASPTGEERAALWRRMDDNVEAESEPVYAAFRKGFGAQLDDVLAALRRAG